jgi:DNA-binding NarL/FixJ family response regulator
VSVARNERRAGVLRVLVLAEDLIWATRLVGQLLTLGTSPVRVGTADAFAAALAAAAPTGPEDGRPTHAVVDLTARTYDGIAVVRLAAAAELRVLCVGQHDDQAHRRAALAAGAERVFSYRKLFEDGHATLAAWLGVPTPVAGSLTAPVPAAGSPALPASSEVPLR